MDDRIFYMKLGYSLALNYAREIATNHGDGKILSELIDLDNNGEERIKQVVERPLEEIKEEEPLFI